MLVIKRREKTQAVRAGGKGLLRRAVSYWDMYLLLVPAIFLTIVFSYIPMYGVQIAFKDFSANKGIWGSDWVGLEHFIRFLNYPNFWKYLGNTLRISLYGIATFPLPIIFALLINELNSTKFKKTVQMLSYAPHFISEVVLCGMVLLFLDRNSGVINHVLEALGFARHEFIAEAKNFSTIYVWSGVWQSLGWSSILYISALSSVSTELLEAARIDGATRMGILTRINLPLIMPTVGIMLILSCGNILSVGYTKILLLQNSLNLDASQVLSSYTYEVGLRGGQFAYSSAIGLFNNVCNIILLLIVNTLSKKFSQISLF